METQVTNSKKIIAFTDSVNECECCGKKGLKGTFCVSIDGQEFYYGSICTFKKHGFAKGDDKKANSDYKKLLIARRFGFNSVEERDQYEINRSKMIEDWANES